MKIAVAVEGENLKIVTRTGRAPYFAIFEFDGNRFKLLNINKNTHAGEHNHKGKHKEEHTENEIKHHHRHIKASNLQGCDYIIARAIGPNMKDALDIEGIKIIKISNKDGNDALEVLEKIKNKFNF